MKKLRTNWKAYHVFYHGNLDILIQQCIKPITKKLLSEGIAEKFFFIRYWEGGPHIRLRVNQLAEDSYKNEEIIVNQINKFLHE
ncbi:hypothetical protein OSK38_27810, partial [Escherichia coli]|nr:hypothetical protein [Escherichia coli]